MEDQDGALLEGEPPEGSLELVAIVDRQEVVAAIRVLSRQDPDRLRPSTAAPGLGVAGVGQDAVEPRLKSFGVTEGADFAPGRDEGRLNGVLGQVDVAQDPTRDRHASVANRPGKGVEGLLVTLLGLVDQ